MNYRKLVLGSLVAIAGLMVTSCVQPDKTAYIDVNKVYAEFDLTKELNQEFIKVENARKGIIDSLEMSLQILATNLNAKEKVSDDEAQNFNALKNSYQTKKQQFAQQNQELQAKYSNQITEQLNQYVKDYGAEKKYTYVFGAQGSGSIMYAIETKNVTDEVIKYINNKYSK